MGKKERFYSDIMAMHPAVTGSSILLVTKFPNAENLRIVVDCGMFQERIYDDYNEALPFNPEAVDICLVTHNHVDHTGRLPLMVQKGYDKKIYATADTCRLLPPALHDSLNVISDIAKRKNKKCLYKEADVDRAIDLLEPCEDGKTIKIHEHVKVTFFINGHLPGAASILVQLSYPEQEDINILFTGDYHNKNIFFDVPKLPQWVLDLPLTIVQESTYGDMDTSEIKPCFRENVARCVNEGGSVVVPVFSLGRAQQIAYEIKCMQKEKMISTDIPIYLDGTLAHKYTNMYLKGYLNIKEEMRDFLPENLTFVDSAIREAILQDNKCKIILTTSGMGSHGPAQMYIPEYVRRKNAMIHFTGFTTEGTMGHRLKTAEEGKTVEVGGMMVKKLAKVEYTNEYSGHAKANEMIDSLNQFSNIRLVLINHGPIDTKEKFAERVLDETNARNVGILGREYLFRINHYGFVKSMTTKFM